MMASHDAAGTPGSDFSGSTPGQRLAYLIELTTDTTQAEFARKTDFSPGWVSEIKQGKRELPPKMAYAIQGVFGYSAEWLLHGSGTPLLKEAPAPYQLPLPEIPSGRPYMVMGGPLGDTAVPIMVPRYLCRNCMGEVQYPARVCRHCGQKLEWPEPPDAHNDD